MPTTTDTISLAKISQYLVGNDIAKGSLFGKKLNQYWDVVLYMERMAIQWAASQSSTYEDIYKNTAYVYWLCYKTIRAQYILNTGGGGSLAPVTSPDDCCIDLFPIKITQADFEADGVSYNNPDIVGKNLTIFVNEVSQQFWYAPTGFVYTPDGIRVTIPGFDANTYEYTILIDQLGNSEGTVTTPTVVNYNLTADNTLIENILTVTADGQKVIVAIVPNGFTYSFDTLFAFGDTPPLQTPNAANTLQIFTFEYFAAISKLVCTAQSLNIPN